MDKRLIAEVVGAVALCAGIIALMSRDGTPASEQIPVMTAVVIAMTSGLVGERRSHRCRRPRRRPR